MGVEATADTIRAIRQNVSRAHLESKMDAIPPHMRSQLTGYILDGTPPGGFVQAVISNNLKRAVYLSDGDNERLLGDYVRFFYNWAPNTSWGSDADFVKWLKAHRDYKESGGQ